MQPSLSMTSWSSGCHGNRSTTSQDTGIRGITHYEITTQIRKTIEKIHSQFETGFRKASKKHKLSTVRHFLRYSCQFMLPRRHWEVASCLWFLSAGMGVVVAPLRSAKRGFWWSRLPAQRLIRIANSVVGLIVLQWPPTGAVPVR